MHDIAPEMLWDGVTIDHEFADEEVLYCRVMPEHIIQETGGAPLVDVAAFELPDKSVNRSKDGGRPETVRHNVYPNCDHKCDGRHHTWAVVSMRVTDVRRWMRNVVEGIAFETRVYHDPLPFNRFHSEIRAFDPGGSHILKDQMERLGWETHYRWRKIVRYCSKIAIPPNQ